ncbi:MAG: HAD family hydrolase [Anaerolineales bacterium]|nr:HAD family hydrolase [Anaerolineales bacterium]
MSSIRAILFDLDGTLRHSVPSFNHMFLDFAVALGVPDSRANRLRNLQWVHYYWAQSPELAEDLSTYGSLTGEFWTYYSYRSLIMFGCAEEQAQALGVQIQKLMTEEYHPEDRLAEDVMPTLHALREAGFAMGVASNRSNAYDEQMAALGLNDIFPFALAAGQINSWKPDSGIFFHAVGLLGVSPHETMYVGDNYFADVIGARRAGLQPLLIDPEGVFPEADCPVIRSLSEILDLVGRGS